MTTTSNATEIGLYDHLTTDQLKTLADRLFTDALDTASWSISQGFSMDMADAKMANALAVEELYLSRGI